MKKGSTDIKVSLPKRGSSSRKNIEHSTSRPPLHQNSNLNKCNTLRLLGAKGNKINNFFMDL